MSDWTSQLAQDGTESGNGKNAELVVDETDDGSHMPKLYTTGQMVYTETPFMLSQLPFWDPQNFETPMDQHMDTQDTARGSVGSREVRFAPPSSAEDFQRRSSTSSQKDDGGHGQEERHQVSQMPSTSILRGEWSVTDTGLAPKGPEPGRPTQLPRS
jgi:hypothetical protein